MCAIGHRWVRDSVRQLAGGSPKQSAWPQQAGLVSSLSTGLSGLAMRLRARRQAFWVFSDQGLVSAINFLLGVVMARTLGVQGFGQWVLLWAMVLYANTICRAVILAPLLTELPRASPADARQQLLRGRLMAHSCSAACRP